MSKESSPQEGDFTSSQYNDLTSSPIRTQLLWSALFPLAIFALISILAAASVFYRLTLNLTTQKNIAQIQFLATFISRDIASGILPESVDLKSILDLSGKGEKKELFIVNKQGEIINDGVTTTTQERVNIHGFSEYVRNNETASRMVHLPNASDDVMVSVSPIPGTEYLVVQVEPWVQIIAPSINYQWLFAGLAFIGVFLSLYTLSLAIDRIINPIKTLAESATLTIPGSIFIPLQETGPREIRTLINAFNKMVIRLAVQQKSLRQYSHTALLSQENERLRISHELHDGTLQDLIGLSQRVELCCQELTIDPKLAQERLDEIQNLLKHTLDDVRNISNALRPTVLEDLGLMIAIDALCKEMNQKKPGLHCEFIKTGIIRRLPADQELAIYRVVQEALTNIRKHVPDASKVSVEIEFDKDGIVTMISNNGSRFFSQDIQGYVKKGHIGLAGMDERARLFGGNLTITSKPGAKTLITLKMPYEQDINY
jgi:signal transduction histidine kinase